MWYISKLPVFQNIQCGLQFSNYNHKNLFYLSFSAFCIARIQNHPDSHGEVYITRWLTQSIKFDGCTRICVGYNILRVIMRNCAPLLYHYYTDSFVAFSLFADLHNDHNSCHRPIHNKTISCTYDAL